MVGKSYPLFDAVGKDRPDIVQVLLQAGANVNVPGYDDWTPLHYASWSGNLEVARVLIAGGASVPQTDKYGNTALHFAAQTCHPDMVTFLLSSGADPNSATSHNNILGATPLMVAATNPDTACPNTIKTLIGAGAKVNHTNPDGYTALFHAAWSGFTDNVRALLAGGADPNIRTKEYNISPLMFAAGNGYTEIVRLLIGAGAEVNGRNGLGKTALMYATKNGYTQIAEMIRQAGATN